MKHVLKASKFINITALLFLLFGPYGIAITGFLQVIAAIFICNSISKKTYGFYIYFAIVGLFFIFWNEKVFDWQFTIPIGLLIFLSFLIHSKKNLI